MKEPVVKNDVGTRLSIVEYKVDELKTGQDKLIDLVAKISYVHISDFDKYKEYVDKVFVKKEQINPWLTFFKAVVTAAAIALATAIISFIVKGGLSK